MLRKLFIALMLMPLAFSSNAQTADHSSLCPVKRFIQNSTPTEFSNKFYGDTIFFSVPNSQQAAFESFKLLVPDTLWLKDRPKNKKPQEYKHYKLITNFHPVSGWGVNSYRQYTPGTCLEQCRFILRGSHTEEVEYLGKSEYLLLEEVGTGKLIKWDYTKNENNGLIIFSPSIIRHLSLMKGLDFVIAENDSTYLPGKCTDIAYSVLVKHKQFIITLDADFDVQGNHLTSHNWSPMFFLKKDEDKLNKNTQQNE